MRYALARRNGPSSSRSYHLDREACHASTTGASSTASSGYSDQEHRGVTCRSDMAPTRPAATASSVGAGRGVLINGRSPPPGCDTGRLLLDGPFDWQAALGCSERSRCPDVRARHCVLACCVGQSAVKWHSGFRGLRVSRRFGLLLASLAAIAVTLFAPLASVELDRFGRNCPGGNCAGIWARVTTCWQGQAAREATCASQVAHVEQNRRPPPAAAGRLRRRIHYYFPVGAGDAGNEQLAAAVVTAHARQRGMIP